LIVLGILRQLVDERTRLTERTTAIAEQAAADGRDVTEAENQELATIRTRCAVLDPQIEQ
jgi:hypothetical protein